MAQAHKFQDLEETGEALVAFITSSQPDSLARMRREQQALLDQQGATCSLVSTILSDVSRVEEGVGQMLLDMEVEKKKMEAELQNVEEQLRQNITRNQITHSELQFLQGELESLRNDELQLSALQSEVEEDTTEVIPSAVHVAQLYHVITKMQWEYDSAPGRLTGVHYGADLATPINIDLSTRSRTDVSDQLWSFISTQW